MASEADKRMLERHRSAMLERIDIENSNLLAELRSRFVIDAKQEQHIRGQTGNDDMVGKLLHYMQRGDGNTVDKFIYALRDSGPNNKAVAKDLLRKPMHEDVWSDDDSQQDPGPSKRKTSGAIGGTTVKKPKSDDSTERMSVQHKKILVAKLDMIAQHMNPVPVLLKLVAEGVFDMDELDVIDKENATDKKKSRALVMLLVKKDDRGMQVLIDACDENSMRAIAKELRDAEPTAGETVRVRRPAPISTEQSSDSAPAAKPTESNTDAVLMTAEHKHAILHHFAGLVDKLTNINDILDEMVGNKILTMYESIEIAENGTTLDKARALLALIIKKQDRAFYVLVEACRRTNQLDLANLLEGDEPTADETVREQPAPISTEQSSDSAPSAKPTESNTGDDAISSEERERQVQRTKHLGDKGKVGRARIMLVGPSGAGKTSLMRTLLGDPFDPKSKSTVGVKTENQIEVGHSSVHSSAKKKKVPTATLR